MIDDLGLRGLYPIYSTNSNLDSLQLEIAYALLLSRTTVPR